MQIIFPGDEKIKKGGFQMGSKFNAGRLCVTMGINNRVADDVRFAEFVTLSLSKHFRGDWGDLSEEDKVENEQALINDGRLFSAHVSDLAKIWIITEADRSATTVLFPHEY
jgi:hypothetical protein